MILNIQEIVLDHCLDPGRAPADPEPGDAERRRQQSAQDRRGLPLAERRDLHRAGRAGGRRARSPYAISTIRRNLQREYIKRLSTMVLGPRSGPLATAATASSSSSAASPRPRPTPRTWPGCTSTRSASKIDKLLGQQGLKIDDTTLAHLKEIHFRIDKVLKANLNVNEP